MKRLIIEFNKDWIYEHSDDAKSPIDVLKEEFTGNTGVAIKASTSISLTLCYEDLFANEEGLKFRIVKILKDNYPSEDVSKVAQFISDEILDDFEDDDDDIDEEEMEDVDIELRMRELLERIDKFANEPDIIIDKEEDENDETEEQVDNVKNIDDKTQQMLDKIDALVGAYEFKHLAKEILYIAEEIKRTNTFDVLANQCYLFSVGDGYGLTTYLNLLAQILWSKKLCQLSTIPVREVRLGEYKESEEPFGELTRTIFARSDGKIRVLCIDISEWMNHTDSKYFRNSLRLLEKHSKEVIVVFRVPFVEKDILERIKYSISDVLSVRTVSFPPFSQDEIKKCAEQQLKKYDFEMQDDAWKYFFERISQEKGDGKFYGVNTITKVVKELVYQMHIVNSQRQIKASQIAAEEAKSLCAETNDINLSGEEMLDKLVGVESIKNRVEEIMTQISLAMQDGAQRPCIHMRFVGNPGTGKTTVARIVGKMLKERGVLRVGAFFEYAGRDFCGRYIGETAPKTASICRDAYGSVLFIDEAYSLYRGKDDVKDFGREAIETLIAEMENHRNDLVVIMAGYTDDMDRLMQGNAGLASRMPYTIEFPNFTREQLGDVFISMVKGKFQYDDGLIEAAREFFTNLPDEVLSAKDFSNARYVRNLFERTWAKAAMRCQLDGKTKITLTGDDFRLASADREFVSKIRNKTRIGF